MHWQPADGSPDAADPAWLRLVLYHLNHNEGMKAVAVAATITRPNTLIVMAADKRFDAVVAADPRHYEMPAAAEVSLEGAKARLAVHPELLEPADTAAKALLRLGRVDEALTVIDQALAKAQPASGASPYADLDDALPWATETRGMVMSALGRTDEATELRKAATILRENGDVNVSQALNLAHRYIYFNQPHEALDVLDRVPLDRVSAYGRMVYEHGRVCANHQLGNASEAGEAMKYLDAHASDAPNQRVDALLCTGDIDGAAAAVVGLLSDPKTVSDALMSLQVFCGSAGCGRDGEETDWDKVRNHRAVKAAVARVGRILTVPIWDYN